VAGVGNSKVPILLPAPSTGARDAEEKGRGWNQYSEACSSCTDSFQAIRRTRRQTACISISPAAVDGCVHQRYRLRSENKELVTIIVGVCADVSKMVPTFIFTGNSACYPS
jgi:hypothetical protein